MILVKSNNKDIFNRLMNENYVKCGKNVVLNKWIY